MFKQIKKVTTFS